VKQISGKEFCKAIEKKGWKLARIRGSHHIFTKQGRIERISIPVHGNKSLKIGLLRALMKMAGIDESDL
jgi:predicted RNA binding protein YcfA (HicA-like mRNA interferase family)